MYFVCQCQDHGFGRARTLPQEIPRFDIVTAWRNAVRLIPSSLSLKDSQIQDQIMAATRDRRSNAGNRYGDSTA